MQLQNLIFQVEKYKPILEEIASILEKKHRANPIPAHPVGKWKHHAYPGGLLEHSLEVAEMATKILGEDRLFLLFKVIALGHDIGKIQGDISPSHPDLSERILFEEIIPQAKKNSKITKALWQEFEKSSITRLIALTIKYHNLNFRNPETFENKGENLFEDFYFPYILLFIVADLASVAKCWLKNNKTY